MYRLCFSKVIFLKIINSSTGLKWCKCIYFSFCKKINNIPQKTAENQKHCWYIFKGGVLSRSAQTFNRAWNRCPSLRLTQWLEITGSFAVAMVRWYQYSSPGRLGGREVQMSARVSRRSWVRIPPESPVMFSHRHSESTEYAVLYTRRCRAKWSQLINLKLALWFHALLIVTILSL